MSTYRVGWPMVALSLGGVGLGAAALVQLQAAPLVLLPVVAAVKVLVALVGTGGLLAAVLVAATSPSALGAGRRRLGSLRRPTSAQHELARAMASASPTYVPFEDFNLRLLTADQLGDAWRNSEAAVLSPCGPRAWLASDAEAADGPLPFATGSRPESPAIDWDELTGGQATYR